MPYKHDILVSVKWDPVFAEWVREYFLPLLKTYLKQAVIVECGRQFEGLFYYKEDIEPGEKWKSKLRHAIKESRCALALCSPEYFYSDYCLLEWHSFSLRGRLMGKNLIIPAAIHDGQAFPDYAIQEKGTSRRYSTTDTGLAVDAAYASPRASSSTSSIMVSKPQMYPRTRAAGLR